MGWVAATIGMENGFCQAWDMCVMGDDISIITYFEREHLMVKADWSEKKNVIPVGISVDKYFSKLQGIKKCSVMQKNNCAFQSHVL